MFGIGGPPRMVYQEEPDECVRCSVASLFGMRKSEVPHFFRSLCETSGLNLHLQVRGENTHHMVEACFKVVARALRLAIRREGSALPSTKGVL